MREQAGVARELGGLDVAHVVAEVLDRFLDVGAVDVAGGVVDVGDAAIAGVVLDQLRVRAGVDVLVQVDVKQHVGDRDRGLEKQRAARAFGGGRAGLDRAAHDGRVVVDDEHVDLGFGAEQLVRQRVVDRVAGDVRLERGRRVDAELVEREDRVGRRLGQRFIAGLDGAMVAIAKADVDARAQALHRQCAGQPRQVVALGIRGRRRDDGNAQPQLTLRTLELADALVDRVLAGQLKLFARARQEVAQEGVERGARAGLFADQGVKGFDGGEGLLTYKEGRAIVDQPGDHAAQGLGARHQVEDFERVLRRDGAQEAAGDGAVDAEQCGQAVWALGRAGLGGQQIAETGPQSHAHVAQAVFEGGLLRGQDHQ